MECVQVSDAGLVALPLGFEQVGFIRELEAPVDLFSSQAKRLAGFQSVDVENAAEQLFKGIAPRLRSELASASAVACRRD